MLLLERGVGLWDELRLRDGGLLHQRLYDRVRIIMDVMFDD